MKQMTAAQSQKIMQTLAKFVDEVGMDGVKSMLDAIANPSQQGPNGMTNDQAASSLYPGQGK